MRSKKAQTIVSMYDGLGNQCGCEPAEQQVRQIFKHVAILCENLDVNGLNEEQASYIDYELTMLYNTLSNSESHIEYLVAEHNFPYKEPEDSRYPVLIIYGKSTNRILLIDEKLYDNCIQDPADCLSVIQTYIDGTGITPPNTYLYVNKYGISDTMKENILLCCP